MIRRILSALIAVLLLLSCVCCNKEGTSPLDGSSWECYEDGDLLVFRGNHSGIYYCKSAIDDVYDKIFSSFDFSYELSGNDISIWVRFSRRVYQIDGTIDGDMMTTTGGHFVRIKHKLPEQ